MSRKPTLTPEQRRARRIEQQRRYREANRERVNAAERARRAANRDHVNALQRASRSARREEVNAAERLRYAARGPRNPVPPCPAPDRKNHRWGADGRCLYCGMEREAKADKADST